MHVRVAIIGGGPAAHTAATYLGRAELQPVSVGWGVGWCVGAMQQLPHL